MSEVDLLVQVLEDQLGSCVVALGQFLQNVTHFADILVDRVRSHRGTKVLLKIKKQCNLTSSFLAM